MLSSYYMICSVYIASLKSIESYINSVDISNIFKSYCSYASSLSLTSDISFPSIANRITVLTNAITAIVIQALENANFPLNANAYTFPYSLAAANSPSPHTADMIASRRLGEYCPIKAFPRGEKNISPSVKNRKNIISNSTVGLLSPRTMSITA